MAVTLRLVRLGRRNRSFFRLRASDQRDATTGRFIEDLGYVDPVIKDTGKQVVLKKERIEHWLGLGAKTSDTVRRLLKKNGITTPARA
ncbi:MAG TPA: 30S ribosomal protein S16 [Phycisphaerae bacterium]|nr:30S ribosomal protein S16 [Phycisphaerae bacterium]